VLSTVLEGRADAVLGVACLDSLEKSFHRVVDLGIPQVVVPLLVDGCVDTRAELDLIDHFLMARSNGAGPRVRSYLPLLHLTTRIFSGPEIERLLDGLGGPMSGEDGDPGAGTGRIAMEWLREGGKRLRPFITLAAYAAARHGETAFGEGVAEDGLIPPAVRRIALAIEVLHKASLVHDDIEDDDDLRYGRQTLHRQYGVPVALNVGDFLLGEGYRLIAHADAPAVAKARMLESAAQSHRRLCIGQGAELCWARSPRPLSVQEVVDIYAGKTAPAFEVALELGAILADAPAEMHEVFHDYSTALGIAYQIRDDVEDLPEFDATAMRPSLLPAMAYELAEGSDRAVLDRLWRRGPSTATADGLADVLRRLDVRPRVRALLDRHHQAAMLCLERLDHPALEALLRRTAAAIIGR